MAILALMSASGVAPAPGVRVLKAADYASFVEAEAVVERAREQAARLLEKAEADAADQRRRGYEEGREEGKAEVAERLFEAVSESVEHVAEMESALVDVVIKSMRTIIGELDREELAVKAVGHALRLVRDEKRVVLRVSVADAPAVEARLRDIAGRYPGMGRVDVAPDASLSPGGCVMETDIGVIDATLERQLTIIEETFRRHLEERRA